MKIGKATVPRTAICTSDAHTIVVRGKDLSKELIGKVSFVEHFFLLLTGALPSAGQAAVLNATLVAIAEHGLVPSVQASRMTYAAAPDALQGAVAILNALYAGNARLRARRSAVPGITHPYLNVGLIQGGTNTNVVPGKVVLKLDRRMIPEENPAEVEATLRGVIAEAIAESPGVTVEVKRMLLANALKPLPGNRPLVDALCKHASSVFGEPIEASGTPLYTDARLFCERGIPAVLYGCGPRTVLESNAKRADEHIELEDLRRATKVVARALFDLLS